MRRSGDWLWSGAAIPAALTRIAAVAAVGAIGTTVLGAADSVPLSALAPAAVQPADVAVVRPVEPQSLAAPARPVPAKKPTVRRPAVKPRPPASRHVVQARPVTRWLPTGIGMWVYQWNRTAHGSPTAVVSQARKVGLTTLFVRTGSSHDGYSGDDLLGRLLPATRGTNVRVVTWDFPELKNPVADARRLARTAWYNRQLTSYPHVAAVAPDIETRAEGTRNSVARVQTYLRALRRYLPRDVAILATVPWPSSARRGHYPYATVAAQSDALLPMAYWYNNKPSVVTAKSIAYLRRFRKPVQPVGQGYDGKLDVHWLPHNNLSRQVPSFFATAHQMGARAVSLWSWQSAPRSVWVAMIQARRWFPARG